MASKNAGGCPASSIIQANFTMLEKVSNKSHQYWYKCNHCLDGSTGSGTQGQDNNHVKHLTDPKKCPNAPADVQKEVRILLAGKGGNNAFFDLAAVLGTSAESAIPLDSMSPKVGSSSVVSIKKRKRNSLEGFFHYALTPAQQNQANIKLFGVSSLLFTIMFQKFMFYTSFIVHANLAFSMTENPYYHEFTDEIRPSHVASSRYVLSHSTMDGEAARVQIEKIGQLKSGKRPMLLIDG